MLKNEERLEATKHLKYLRDYLHEMEVKKNFYEGLTKQKLLVYLIKGFFLNFCCNEFVQINYKISKITEIVGLFEEVLKLSRTMKNCEVQNEQLCLHISILNSAIIEEACKDFYPKKFQEVSSYIRELFLRVFDEVNEKKYQLASI